MTERLDRIALVITAGAIGFCFGEMLSGETRGVDWETLVTGLLAIAAAAWTVKATFGIDRQQERRHRQLVALTLRADKLKVMRARFGAVDTLRRLAFSFEDQIVATRKALDNRPAKALEELEQARFIWLNLALAQKVMNAETLHAAVPLFEAAMNQRYVRLGGFLNSISQQDVDIARASLGSRGSFAPEDNQFDRAMESLLTKLPTIAQDCKVFSDELDALADEYARET
ncbi:hypothetical protein EN817_02935 [Mesorhizobium sp. M3A.F.Ca.ET.174.01.1.1]|uniref:hypothetical protein n=1 Tax=unclassified Mesorhizobium TaxID=325217 RepID=UPI001093F524|nr:MULTISPECIES: hypothetical protein [unclassified Mesorhizobium]TGS89321.1 hypothetical protein EN818_02935 [Mesorhizobium sp. M3A.F.Ca.ET.175.01.1.1]TGT31094.1 hypothetical protein EN817_02935 [Mesorhizobium sp. M3A.F.Ca.ET.174.01.1.1]